MLNAEIKWPSVEPGAKNERRRRSRRMGLREEKAKRKSRAIRARPRIVAWGEAFAIKWKCINAELASHPSITMGQWRETTSWPTNKQNSTAARGSEAVGMEREERKGRVELIPHIIHNCSFNHRSVGCSVLRYCHHPGRGCGEFNLI